MNTIQKGKGVSMHVMKAHRGREAQLHSFLTLVLGGS
jgi:hypothetical protein